MFMIHIYSRRISVFLCAQAKKLGQYQNYHNETRAHSSLNRKMPNQKTANNVIPNKMTPLRDHCWKSHIHGLFNLPIAA